jgi:hypothetical protein
LYLKRPYLTNGSVGSLEALLANVRSSEDDFSHAGPAERPGSALANDEQRVLVAFLSIL